MRHTTDKAGIPAQFQNLYNSVDNLFDLFESLELKCLLLDLLQMATTSERYRSMNAEDSERLFGQAALVIDNLMMLSDSFDAAQKEVCHA